MANDDDLIRRGDALAEVELFRGEWSSARDAIAALDSIEPAPVTLAEALQVPEVQALVEAANALAVIIDRNNGKGPIPDVEMMFCWLAAADVRAAMRAIDKT